MLCMIYKEHDVKIININRLTKSVQYYSWKFGHSNNCIVRCDDLLNVFGLYNGPTIS